MLMREGFDVIICQIFSDDAWWQIADIRRKSISSMPYDRGNISNLLS